MKLHRLVLTNYRGVAHREIEFPERGVVVVSGANEVGKTSMIEALDLLLEAKDRSNKREVKQVKPTHADVGSEVTAEISTGPYRFVYRKRFHKQTLTELSVLAPSRAQLTGDPAHERVLAMLEETVDMELWRAQRILQSASTEAVQLSSSDALSCALDVAAGAAVALSGSEPLLVERIDTEYRQYFTATGRPTSEWLAATKRLEHACAEVARCEAAVAEVEDAVGRHGELTEQLARLALDRAAAVRRLEGAQRAADAVATLVERLGQGNTLVDALETAHAASVAAVDQRSRQSVELDVRAAAIGELAVSVHRAQAEQTSGHEASAAAAAAAGVARAEFQRADAHVQAARQCVDDIARRDEAARLGARLERLDAARAELQSAEHTLAAITLSDRVMKDVETAVAAVDRAGAQVESASARVEVTAVADVTVQIAGEPVALAAGCVHEVGATAATAVEVPGLMTVRVVPGAPAADSQALFDAACEHLAAVLRDAGAADVAEARALDDRRRELLGDRDRLAATCDGLLGDDDAGSLRGRLADLKKSLPADRGIDDAAARTELAAAVAAHRDAGARSDALRTAAELAAAGAAEQTTLVTVLSERLSSARDELTAATEALVLARAATTDEQLSVRADANAERARAAAAHAQALDAELAGLEPAAVAAELAEAGRGAESLAARHDEVGEHLLEVAARLKVYGSEGRKGRLDDAEAEREHAASEHARLRRRSSAADLLRSVMTRHRDAARLRYVEPFRNEVQRLGRIVFGDDFEVEIDGALRICSRTLNGNTVPFDSLSGGAKEQLGIVARLAGAALVAKEDGVPVVIDDALGFTDAVRLAKMGEVFNAVAGDGQVIVLTCSPERYAGVGDAHLIELSGSPLVSN